MYKYFNHIVICNELHKQNKEQEEEIERLKKELKDLQYKYDGVDIGLKEIYDNYKKSVIKSLK